MTITGWGGGPIYCTISAHIVDFPSLPPLWTGARDWVVKKVSVYVTGFNIRGWARGLGQGVEGGQALSLANRKLTLNLAADCPRLFI